jgi:hypothetical protein
VPAMQLIRAVAGHQRHPTRPQRAGQEGDQVTGGTVGPVQILQHHHDRGLLRSAHQQGAHGVKDLQLVLAVADEPTRRPGLLEPGQQPAQAGRGGGDLSQQLCLGRIVAKATQGVHDGQVGKADVAQLHTAAGEHPHPSPTGLVGELQEQTGFADPSIAGQQHDLRPALLGPVQCCLEPAQLISPADEPLRCEPAHHARQYGRGQRGWKRAGADCRPVSIPAVGATYALVDRRTSRHQRRGARWRRRSGNRLLRIRRSWAASW